MSTGFGQICPVAMACEVFAQRWTPIILREIFAGSESFNDIHRGLPLISRALLARRLRDLEAHGVIAKEHVGEGRRFHYRLTDAGREFGSVIESLGAWGQRWTARVAYDNLDPSFLMWNMRRRIALDRLPQRRVVVNFKYGGVPVRYRGPRLFWLLLEHAQADLCLKDPGFDVDLYVEADLTAAAKVWLGDISFDSALRSGKLRLAGSRELTRAFPSWLMLSRFAAVPRPGEQALPG